MNLQEIENDSRTYERFLKRISIKISGCWEPSGFKDKDGYTFIHIYNGPGGNKRAHRFVYELHKGAMPDSMVIDHICRNRGCVNPDHLEVVTIAENNKRAKPFYDFSKYNMQCLNSEERATRAKRASDAAREKVLKRNTCRRGHEWKPETTYTNPSGARRCQICFYNTPSMIKKNK